MKEIILNSYKDIKGYCTGLNYCTGNQTLYRGTKTNFLVPSIYKASIEVHQLVEIESKIHKAFSGRYSNTIAEENRILKDWKIRIMGREHGLRNRLMDWTFTFYNAVDFATYTKCCETIKDEYVYVWALNWDQDRRILNDLRGFPFSNITNAFTLNEITGTPQLHASRQLVQGGHFLVVPDNMLSQPINNQQLFSSRLTQIKIPAGNINTIRHDLAKTEGVNLSKSLMIRTTFTDLYCQYLNRKYFR